jgi:hypothetical protein
MPILPKYRTKFSNNAEKEIYNHAVNSKYFDNNLKRYFFHSLRNHKAKGKVVGEVDFVYLDETHIIFLESKGGPVKYDSISDTWWVLGGKKKGDPFKQVTDYLFHFRDNLLGKFYPEKNYRSKLIFGYGVMFPDVEAKTTFRKKSKKSTNFKYETIEYDPQIIYSSSDHEDSEGFVKYIEGLKRYWQEYDKYSNRMYYGIGLKGVDDIRKLFRRDLIFEVPLKKVIVDENRNIERYTEEQYNVLDTMSFLENRGFVVSGGPGTGKTLLAKEIAIRKQHEGLSVGYFCFNKNLAAEISRHFQSISLVNVEAYHVHEFLFDSLSKSSLLPSGDRSSSEFWREILPTQFKKWYSSLSVPSFDYIIIDEGQDVFSENLIDSIFCSLNGGVESGKWAIFIDFKYQGFYEGFDQEYFRLFVASYQCSMTNLPLNCRNHDDIISVASRHSGLDIMPCRRTKIPFKTRTYFYESHQDLFKRVEQICQSWRKENIDLSSISILTTEKDLITQIERSISLPFHRVNIDAHKEEGKISISTIHGYKGLENDFIIIAGIENYIPTDKESMSLLFVGYTRARLGLAICFSSLNKTTLAINVLG